MSKEKVLEILGCSCGNGRCEDCAQELLTALARVLEFHKPMEIRHGFVVLCQGCVATAGVPMSAKRSILARLAWPCVTVRLMDGNEAPLDHEEAT